MWKWFNNRVLLICIFLLAFALRFGAIVYVDNFDTPESWEDGVIAKNLLEGKGFSYDWLGPTQPTSFAAPFYPFFLATFYYIFGIASYTHLMILVVQAIVSSWTCVVIYAIGKRLFDASVGVIAAVISCVYPVFIYTTTQVIRVTFIIFFVSLLVLYLMKLRDRPRRKDSVVLGLLCGITILSEPVLVSFIVCGIGWLLLAGRNKTLALKNVAYVAIVTILVIMPWTVRNCIVHGRLMFIKTQVGYTLWIGNNPDATGTGRRFTEANTPIKTWNELRRELNAKVLTEAECDDVLKKRALLFIKENPGRFGVLVLKKLYYFWWYDKTHPLARSMAYVVPYATVLLFSVFGLAFARLNGISGTGLSLIYVLFLSITIPYAVTFVLPRYRMPIEPYLLILSAAGIRHLFALFKR